ncbi:zinc metalloprotease [Aeromicrobium fastidiosum]|uniref:Peptidase n=1 Tax=Aeromicrobium fastidiosum TaxID=52699 RepID=A0A641ATG7_9ACTN|nr:peptidase [Aeromicrobium fastidiosum]KAA1380178.1 peptidase [Aeromicrobium fastidiosum]MBP2389717.1 hypothetical protein [Aeromicrobium fastidiosum]
MAGRWRDALLLAEPRRRRRVARLVRRLERLERKGTRPGPCDHRIADPVQAPAGERGHRRAATAVAVLVLLLGGLFVSSLLRDGMRGGGVFPDRPADAADAPLGTPSPGRGTAEGDSDAYAFTATQEGDAAPVTYDPCVPIHVVVDPRTMVKDGMRLLDEALERVREATGLVFVVDGLVEGSETAPEDGDKDADDLRGPDGGWAPVAVTWSDPGASPTLDDRVAGYAGSASVERDGHRWFVTGSVVLDGPQLEEILDRRGGWRSARAIVMHEVGHLVGLDHVDAPGQLMQPEGDGRLDEWGAGDRTGLAALGSGRCVDY